MLAPPKLTVDYSHEKCHLCRRGECIQSLQVHPKNRLPLIIHGHGMEHLVGSWIVEEEETRAVVYYQPWSNPLPAS